MNYVQRIRHRLIDIREFGPRWQDALRFGLKIMICVAILIIVDFCAYCYANATSYAYFPLGKDEAQRQVVTVMESVDKLKAFICFDEQNNMELLVPISGEMEATFPNEKLPPEWGPAERKALDGKIVRYTWKIVTFRGKKIKLYSLFSDDPTIDQILEKTRSKR